MANYYSVGRTNYFAVRDTAALRKLLGDSGIELDTDSDGRVVLLDGEGTGWTIYDEDGDDEVFLPDVIAGHLEPGQVAVFQSVGSERLRYLGGTALAVNDGGDQVVVQLDDIYAAAAQAFGVPIGAISVAEY